MARFSDLLLRLKTDGSGLTTGLNKAKGDVAGLRSAFSSLNGVLAGVGLGIGVSELGRSLLDSLKNVDRYRAALNLFSGSAALTEKQLQRLDQVSRLPGLTFDGVADGVIRLQSAGFTFERSVRTARAFGQALSVLGGDARDVSEVLRQLSQSAANPFFQGDELRIIAERLPIVRQLMVEAFGTSSTERLKQMGVGVQQVIDVLVSGLEKIQGSTDQTGNKMLQLEEAWKRLIRTLATGPTGGGLKWLIDGLTKALETTELLLRVSGVFFGELTSRAGGSSGPLDFGFGASITAMSSFSQAAEKAVKAIERYRIEAKLSNTENLNAANVNKATTQTALEKLKVEQQAEAAAKNAAKAAEERAKRYREIYDQEFARVRAQQQAAKIITDAEEDIARVTQDTQRRMSEAWYDASRAINEAALKQVEVIPFAKLAMDEWVMSMNPVPLIVANIIAENNKLEEAFRSLGATSDAVANSQLQNLGAALDLIFAQYEAGRVSLEALVRALEAYDSAVRKVQDLEEPVKRAQRPLLEVSTVVTDLSRGLADAMLQARSFGDVFQRVARDLAAALIRTLIEGALVRMLGLLTGIIGKIPGLAKIGGIFGGGASVAGEVASGTKSAISGVASAAKGAIGGLTGIVGAVGSVASAFVGFMAMRQQEKDMDVLHKHTLATVMALHAIDTWLRGSLSDIHARLIHIVRLLSGELGAVAVGGAGVGGGMNITFQVTGGYYLTSGALDDFVRQITDRLRQQFPQVFRG